MKKITITCLIFALGTLMSYSQDLIFTYDTAGNQINYIYRNAKSQDSTTDKIEETLFEEALSEKEILENKFSVSPNPTSGEATLQWEPDIQEEITHIELVSLVNNERQPISFSRKNSVAVNLYDKPIGLYLVIFHLTNQKFPSVQKKLIKR